MLTAPIYPCRRLARAWFVRGAALSAPTYGRTGMNAPCRAYLELSDQGRPTESSKRAWSKSDCYKFLNMQSYRPARMRAGIGSPASAHCELQQFDRIVILHAAAHAFGRVEQDVRFRRVGIAQHGHSGTIDHEIAAVEVTERSRQRAGGNVRHVLDVEQREVQQACAARRRRRRLPEIVSGRVLELAHD